MDTTEDGVAIEEALSATMLQLLKPTPFPAIFTALQPQGASRGLRRDGRWPSSKTLHGAAMRGMASTSGGANRG